MLSFVEKNRKHDGKFETVNLEMKNKSFKAMFLKIRPQKHLRFLLLFKIQVPRPLKDIKGGTPLGAAWEFAFFNELPG